MEVGETGEADGLIDELKFEEFAGAKDELAVTEELFVPQVKFEGLLIMGCTHHC